MGNNNENFYLIRLDRLEDKFLLGFFSVHYSFLYDEKTNLAYQITEYAFNKTDMPFNHPSYRGLVDNNAVEYLKEYIYGKKEPVTELQLARGIVPISELNTEEDLKWEYRPNYDGLVIGFKKWEINDSFYDNLGILIQKLSKNEIDISEVEPELMAVSIELKARYPLLIALFDNEPICSPHHPI